MLRICNKWPIPQVSSGELIYRKSVMEVMIVTVIITSVSVVAGHGFNVGLVQHDTNQVLVDVWCRVQRMLDDVDFGSSPLHYKNEAIHQRRGRPNIHNRR